MPSRPGGTALPSRVDFAWSDIAEDPVRAACDLADESGQRDQKGEDGGDSDEI